MIYFVVTRVVNINLNGYKVPHLDVTVCDISFKLNFKVVKFDHFKIYIRDQLLLI